MKTTRNGTLPGRSTPLALPPALPLAVALGLALLPAAAWGQDPPPPPPAAEGAEINPEPTQATLPTRMSWTGDRTRLQAGDLVTILVDEYTLATADRNQNRSMDRDRKLGLSGGSGGTAAVNVGVRSENDQRDRLRAETYRRDRLAAEVTARVLEVGPDGSLLLEGKRLLRIDDHDQTLSVRGWVRAADVGGGNTVPSFRLADAEILYETNGRLGRNPSLLGRLVDRLWP